LIPFLVPEICPKFAGNLVNFIATLVICKQSSYYACSLRQMKNLKSSSCSILSFAGGLFLTTVTHFEPFFGA
jgi:hypothetical protein